MGILEKLDMRISAIRIVCFSSFVFFLSRVANDNVIGALTLCYQLCAQIAGNRSVGYGRSRRLETVVLGYGSLTFLVVDFSQTRNF